MLDFPNFLHYTFSNFWVLFYIINVSPHLDVALDGELLLYVFKDEHSN